MLIKKKRVVVFQVSEIAQMVPNVSYWYIIKIKKKGEPKKSSVSKYLFFDLLQHKVVTKIERDPINNESSNNFE